jgi:tetratricopeptide (TPR) repeat protein
MSFRRIAAPFPITCILACVCAGQGTFAQSMATARIPPPSPYASAEELVQRAETLHAEKDYLDALDYYRAALAKQNSPVTWNRMGMTQLLLDRDKDARKSFEKAAKLDKTYADAINNIGVTYYKTNKYSRAIKYYKKALAIHEDNASFHSNLGAAYFSKKEFNRAVAEYQRAFELDPTIFEHNSNAGVIARMSSPADRARYFYLLAKMYAGDGDLTRSLECLRRAMEDGYSEIGNVYKDKEFAGLRKDPRFNDLMASKPIAVP